ncbi:MAG: ribonuclease HI [Chloroflexi bacterium]|nr:ribonuclease HI [Chloroflexota bacterium]MCC6896961.1 ribonuclease HI [Anaerolineae bacterium]
MAKPQVTIYSDGGAKPNPGAGGWAALIIENGQIDEISGREPNTTNNRMELMAAIMALQALEEASEIDFHTDSQYLKNGITQWMSGWVRNGWLTANKQPVQNQDLWETLHEALEDHTIKWHWVKGHATSKYNNRVDELATAAREQFEAAPMSAPAPKANAKADVKLYVYSTMDYTAKMGGWGVTVETPDGVKVYAGSEANSSDNQMVLVGCARVLEELAHSPQPMVVYSDSEYLTNGMSKWLAGWVKRGWKTAAGEPVKNQVLWKRLQTATQGFNIQWEHLEKFEHEHSKKAVEAAKKAVERAGNTNTKI